MKKYILYTCSLALSLITSLPINLSATTPNSLDEKELDVVILGGGIGGMTSAIYLARSGIKPVIIEGPEPGGQILQSPGVQNWPGELEIAGTKLTEKTREQAEASGAQILQAEAISVDFSTTPFTITLRDSWHPTHQKVLRAKTCIIATGALPNHLHVPGETTYWSHGVYTCATCDGALYKGRNVAVVGGGDGAIVEAHHLAKLAAKVTLIVRGNSLKSIEEKRKDNLLSLPNVEVLYETEVKEIQGQNGQVTELRLTTKNKTEKRLPVDALFLAIGTKPNTELFKGQLEFDATNHIKLQKDQSTSKPGVFAVGDVSDPHYRQAITAAGDGAKAALQVEEFLAAGSANKPLDRTSPTTSGTIAAIKAGTLDKHIAPEVVMIQSLEQFNREVLESDIPVVVDFYADWCGPCRSLHPRIEAWSQQFQGKMKFAKVNVDYMQKLAQRYRISALPTVLYFEKEGKLSETRIGPKEIVELMNRLEERVRPQKTETK